MSQATAQLAGFGEDLFAGRLRQRERHFPMLERSAKGSVVFAIDQNDSEGGAEYIQKAATGFAVQVLPAVAEQVPLQQAIGEQDEDHRIDDETEGAGREIL